MGRVANKTDKIVNRKAKVQSDKKIMTKMYYELYLNNDAIEGHRGV